MYVMSVPDVFSLQFNSYAEVEGGQHSRGFHRIFIHFPTVEIDRTAESENTEFSPAKDKCAAISNCHGGQVDPLFPFKCMHIIPSALMYNICGRRSWIPPFYNSNADENSGVILFKCIRKIN